jgi:hypothetical protein
VVKAPSFHSRRMRIACMLLPAELRDAIGDAFERNGGHDEAPERRNDVGYDMHAQGPQPIPPPGTPPVPPPDPSRPPPMTDPPPPIPVPNREQPPPPPIDDPPPAGARPKPACLRDPRFARDAL